MDWAYAPADGWGSPTGFHVFLSSGQGPAVEDPSPSATVSYTPGRVGYSCLLPGPYALSTYTADVRPFNPAGAGGSPAAVTGVLGLPGPYAMEAVQVTSGSSVN